MWSGAGKNEKGIYTVPLWLQSVIDFLNANNGIITALATVVLAVITWWYVRLMKKYVQLTQENVQLTQEILKAGNKAEVLIFLFPDETHPYCINLCIQNIGTGFAHDIQFEGDFSFTPILPPGWKPLSENGILKNGIDYLPHGKKIEIFLFMTNAMAQEMSPGRATILEDFLDITVTYKDSANTKNKKTFMLEFSPWENYGQSQNKPISEIADTLERRIAEDLSEIKRILEYRFEKRQD